MSCDKCQLCNSRKNIVVGVGSPTSKIVFIGEAPGEEEDNTGIPFVGRAGEVFDRALEQAGLTREEVWIDNTVRCRPPKNREPLVPEIEACSEHIAEVLDRLQPNVVVLMGKVAISTAIDSGRTPKQPIKNLVGKVYVSEGGLKLIASYHPAAVLYAQGRSQESGDELFRSIVASFQLAKTTAEDRTIQAPVIRTGFVPDDAVLQLPDRHVARTNFITCYNENSVVYYTNRDRDGRLVSKSDTVDYISYLRREDYSYVVSVNSGYFTRLIQSGLIERVVIGETWVELHTNPETILRMYPQSPDRYKPGMFVSDRIRSDWNLLVYEADVPLVKYWAVHNQAYPVEQYTIAFIDIETKDDVIDPFNVGEHRIVSIATSINGEMSWGCISADTDEAERRLLLDWVNELKEKKVDVIVAWNGDNFDFPFLQKRIQKRSVVFNPKRFMWIDMMELYQRSGWYSGGEEAVSFSLDSMGEQVLGEGKLERTMGIMELWRKDRAFLERYNCKDVRLMTGLEAVNQLVAVQILMCVETGVMADNDFPSDKVETMILRTGLLNGVHFPSSMGDPRPIAGAYVVDPVIGFHKGVASFDFSSLYPSILRTFCISPETYIFPDQAGEIPAEHKIVAPNGAAFHRTRNAFIPRLIEWTADKRNSFRAEMKQFEPGTLEYSALDSKQYTMKQIGLCFWGVLAHTGSRFFNPDMSEAVTLTGQHFLQKSIDVMDELLPGTRALMGDTDSNHRNVGSVELAIDAMNQTNRRIEEYVNWNFNPIKNYIKIDFEKYYYSIVYVTKKRYFGLVNWLKGKFCEQLEIKGLEAIRKDNLQIVRDTQRAMMWDILKERPVEELEQIYCRDFKEAVVGGNLTVEALTFTKSISKPIEEYGGDIIDSKTGLAKVRQDGEVQQRSVPIHAKIAQTIRDSGGQYYVGMRVSYVITGTDPLKGIPVEQFTGEYDKVYYWDNVCYPPIERILKAVYPDRNWDQYYLSVQYANERMVNKIRDKIEAADTWGKIEKCKPDQEAFKNFPDGDQSYNQLMVQWLKKRRVLLTQGKRKK